MGLSLRLLMIDRADRIYRLDTSRLERMRANPKMHPLPQFAGERVRGAEAVVELVHRKPTRLIRMTFDILTFDGTGCFDMEAFDRHQFGRFASRLSSVGQLPVNADPATDVLDARYLFDDRGGRWAPSATLLRAMQDAVLGNLNVPRL